METSIYPLSCKLGQTFLIGQWLTNQIVKINLRIRIFEHLTNFYAKIKSVKTRKMIVGKMAKSFLFYVSR